MKIALLDLKNKKGSCHPKDQEVTKKIKIKELSQLQQLEQVKNQLIKKQWVMPMDSFSNKDLLCKVVNIRDKLRWLVDFKRIFLMRWEGNQFKVPVISNPWLWLALRDLVSPRTLYQLLMNKVLLVIMNPRIRVKINMVLTLKVRIIRSISNKCQHLISKVIQTKANSSISIKILLLDKVSFPQLNQVKRQFKVKYISTDHQQMLLCSNRNNLQDLLLSIKKWLQWDNSKSFIRYYQIQLYLLSRNN